MDNRRQFHKFFNSKLQALHKAGGQITNDSVIGSSEPQVAIALIATVQSGFAAEEFDIVHTSHMNLQLYGCSLLKSCARQSGDFEKTR